ncbi:hypothetical protein SERLA73DRAFT_130545 [Serpula lacrymans var. lacrymans S7.3]|uniref:Uncharacterized protein n=2 Tax=Serpula lacrymans var. lacrymans TaxID=341189 RepID=F8PL53_SERL3|nr:uncharacterized protein SERLADRAFT_379396 [Serpula lacrymans var. lacrymans S7.9]EGO03961.1 hypothetical protein SERLA73DRAFT_130545 [Serpula lacrymans var. lacrymans S7.3]EGO29880.1 hypothetical protein SERLADRAFT_379396 [Serpula lacrymans var. lacrymans S7.9]
MHKLSGSLFGAKWDGGIMEIIPISLSLTGISKDFMKNSHPSNEIMKSSQRYEVA